ncbi:MAG: 3-dehydroquinate synthase [Bacteroidota bacterium]
MIDYPIKIGDRSLQQLQEHLQSEDFSQIMVIADENTAEHCYPILQAHLPPHYLCKIPAGESHKNLGTCIYIWQQMTAAAFDRKALIINLGGGVIGDMGGFVAGTYKRGMRFIQIPTTLLSQVDASVGGKLGIDFQGFKNHIGLFREPEGVYIYPAFLQTLSKRELHSGFAEVFKHHLIADAEAWQSLKLLDSLDKVNMAELIEHSVKVKAKIVEADPFEHGARKALNFGHTIGHAVESHFLTSETPLLHGEAIAIGMIAESFLSQKAGLLSPDQTGEIVAFIKRFYDFWAIEEKYFEAICGLSLNDKKNQAGKILCTFLEDIGQFRINQKITAEDIAAGLRFFNQIL